jgi:hypothetical protein
MSDEMVYVRIPDVVKLCVEAVVKEYRQKTKKPQPVQVFKIRPAFHTV